MRPVAAYLAGHMPGALNVPVSGSSFSTKAGFVLDVDRPICVLATSHEEASRAIKGLSSAAFFSVSGYVLGGGPESMAPVTVDELESLVAAGAVVVDVREPDELELGVIPGSVNVPYRLSWTADVPEARTLVTVCETGPRACIAASVLRARGHDARPIADGGMATWLAARSPQTV